MKRYKALCSLFICLCVLIGCNQNPYVPEEGFSKGEAIRPDEKVTQGNDEDEKKDEGYNTEIVIPEQTQFDVEKINRMLEEFNRKERFLSVIPLSGETLLLRCQNRENEEYVFYALHMKTGNESLQRMELNLVGEVDCFVYEDCIVLYDTGNHVVVLDPEFEILNGILIPDSIHPSQIHTEKRNYCLMPREQKVLYYKTVIENGELFDGLYETDYMCEEKRLIYKMDGPEKNLNYLNGFVRICPGYSQEGIFFTGYYFESIDTQSKKCVGYLDLNAGEPVVYMTNMQRMELMTDGVVFFDGYCEREGEYSGELLMIDESGNVSHMKTAYFKESERVGCDLQGRMLTCYETESGETVFNLYKEKVWEKQVVISYSVEDFILLNQGKCILCTYRSLDGLRISLQDI